VKYLSHELRVPLRGKEILAQAEFQRTLVL